MPPNDTTRNHLVAKTIISSEKCLSFRKAITDKQEFLFCVILSNELRPISAIMLLNNSIN